MNANQGALEGFEPTAPYQPHSATSKAAAARVIPKVLTKREQVFQFIEACGKAGATDDEIQRILRMNPNTQRPRRVELVEDKRIADSGRTRKTQYGEPATVWVAVEGQASE